MKKNFKKFFFLFFVIMFGTLVFYSILNISDALEKKGFRLGKELKSDIEVSLNRLYSEEEKSKIITDLKKIDRNITFVNFQEVFSLGTMKDKKLKNIYVYDTYDDLLKSLSNHEFTLSKNWNEPKLPNQDTHDFEIIIQRSFAFSILHSDLGIPKDKIIIDDIIGHIFKNIDVNTGIVYRLKIVGYFNSDLGSLTHGFTTKDSVSKLNVETKRRLQINTRNALKSDKTLKLTNDYLLETLELSPDQIMDWQDGNEVIVNLVYVERISLVLIQILTAIAISIGIANVIAFDAKEKTKQIGILKALGITNNKAVSIFHIQATIISVFAIISGIVLGNLVSKLFPLVFKSSYGVPLIYPNQSVFNYWSVLTIIVMLLSNQLGMYIPGLSIKSLSIIEVIKGD